MTGRLDGKRAIVTGATGGIGSAAVRAFAAEGAVVGLLARPSDALDALASELGDSATSLPCDLTDQSQIIDSVARWRAERDGLDVVYSSAGVQYHGIDGITHETSLDVWHQTFAVNATGAFLTLKYTLPLMVESGGGSVIVCGSPTGLTMTGAGYTAYASSKAAAMALVRVIAADYAVHTIRANTIVPGTTATPLIAELLADTLRRSELEVSVPIGRIATPDDLTGIAVFLASDESRYATGALFMVDGGLTVR